MTRTTENDRNRRWEKLFEAYFDCFLSLAHVPSTNMEEAGFMTYPAASHQGAMQMFWLHVCIVMSKFSLMKLREPFSLFSEPTKWHSWFKEKAQGMEIQCAFNPLLNRERHLVGSGNKENASRSFRQQQQVHTNVPVAVQDGLQ